MTLRARYIKARRQRTCVSGWLQKNIYLGSGVSYVTKLGAQNIIKNIILAKSINNYEQRYSAEFTMFRNQIIPKKVLQQSV